MAAWAFQYGKAAGRFTDKLPLAEALHLPLATKQEVIGVLSVKIASEKPPTIEQRDLLLSFASAENLAAQNPNYASQITAAAKSSFLEGDQWAYAAGAVAILLGPVLVFFMFPKKVEEEELRATYHATDTR